MFLVIIGGERRAKINNVFNIPIIVNNKIWIYKRLYSIRDDDIL